MDKSLKKMLMLLALGLTMLAVVFTIYWKNSSGSTGDGNSNGSSFATLIPIWVAVFVPLIASQNKNKTVIIEGKRKWIVGLLIGVAVLVFVTVFLMFL